MCVAAAMIAEDILQGVGNRDQAHREQGKVAMHSRRRTSAEETQAFVRRKDAGDYKDRLVEKGII